MLPPYFDSYFYLTYAKYLNCSTLFLGSKSTISHHMQSHLLFALLSFDPAIMAHKISLQIMQSMLNESSSHSSHLNYVEMEVCVSCTDCCGHLT